MSVNRSRVSAIKKSQKESLIRKELGQCLQQLAADRPGLRGLMLSRVHLSDDRHYATIYFYMPDGEQAFEKKLEELLLFKPSLRKALAQTLVGRYVPDLVFAYDNTMKKQLEIERTLDALKDEFVDQSDDES